MPNYRIDLSVCLSVSYKTTHAAGRTLQHLALNVALVFLKP